MIAEYRGRVIVVNWSGWDIALNMALRAKEF